MAGEIDELVEVVRTLAHGLVPPVLDELGLVPAIVDLADRHRISGGLDLVVTADDVVVDGAVTQAVYGIVAEAVRNAVRHADAIVVRDHRSRVGTTAARRHGGRRRCRDVAGAGDQRRRAVVDARTGRRDRSHADVIERRAGHARRASCVPSLVREPIERVSDDRRPSIRVVVVDDHPVFRLGMVALLTSIDGFDVVGEAATPTRRSTCAARESPDVIVMDLHLGPGSGIDATRRILERQPDIGVLAVTMMDDDDSVFAAMRAGARGYLLKGAAPDDIERAVRVGGQRRGDPRPAGRRAGDRLPAVRAVLGGGRVSRADRARARDPRPGRPRPRQHERVEAARPQPEDRSGTTCRTCSPSCRSPTARRRSSAPATPGSASRADDHGGADAQSVPSRPATASRSAVTARCGAGRRRSSRGTAGSARRPGPPARRDGRRRRRCSRVRAGWRRVRPSAAA